MTPINKLIKFCLNETKKGNHFFFGYNGHVETFDMRGYIGRWEMNKEPIEIFSCRLNEIDSSKADKWIAVFKNALSQYS